MPTVLRHTSRNVFLERVSREVLNYDDRGQDEGHVTPLALPPVIIIPELSGSDT